MRAVYSPNSQSWRGRSKITDQPYLLGANLGIQTLLPVYEEQSDIWQGKSPVTTPLHSTYPPKIGLIHRLQQYNGHTEKTETNQIKCASINRPHALPYPATPWL